jgi:hypothetical protein
VKRDSQRIQEIDPVRHRNHLVAVSPKDGDQIVTNGRIGLANQQALFPDTIRLR